MGDDKNSKPVRPPVGNVEEARAFTQLVADDLVGLPEQLLTLAPTSLG